MGGGNIVTYRRPERIAITERECVIGGRWGVTLIIAGLWFIKRMDRANVLKLC